MNLESLPNELLLDLFKYFNTVDLLLAFHGRNSRLNEILFNHFEIHSFDFRSVSKSDFDIVCQQHLPLMANRISSLHLSDGDDTPQQPDLFLSHGFSLCQFTHLRSLSLYHLRSSETMENIISDCRHLIHLNITKCFFVDDSERVERLFNIIWSLPKLLRCHLDIIFLDVSHVPIQTVVSSSIEHLSIEDDPFNLTDLSRLFQSTPSLRNLCVRVEDSSDIQQLPSMIPLITTFKISFEGSFHVMTILLKNMPNLCHLTVEIGNICIDGYQWETVIVDFLPKLKTFRFLMDFSLHEDRTIEEQVDALLDSFRTRFWLTEHRWFVRCDCDTHVTKNFARIYTLPYAFETFFTFNINRSKSTCPNDRIHWSYDRVHTLWYNSSLSKFASRFPIRFSHIRHLELSFPFNENFQSIFPTFNRLISLELQSAFRQQGDNDRSLTELRILLNCAPRLYSLTIDYLLFSQLSLIKTTNRSIRRLNLQANDGHFYGSECISLIHSMFNFQCEILLINIENRTIVLDLVHTMSNLRAFTFQCQDDTWEDNGSSSLDDELVQWLQYRLPSSCSIVRDTSEMSTIRLWIRHSCY